MYGRHRNGLGIDPATGTGIVIGSDGKEYKIRPGAQLFMAQLAGVNLTGANLERADLGRADLTEAKLEGANLTGAGLTGANFTNVIVDPEHVLLIEAATKKMIGSLKVNGRTPNPGLGTRRGPGGYKY